MMLQRADGRRIWVHVESGTNGPTCEQTRCPGPFIPRIAAGGKGSPPRASSPLVPSSKKAERGRFGHQEKWAAGMGMKGVAKGADQSRS